jgi:hypothetical protein
MNTFQYLSIIIKDEFHAVREQFRETKLIVIAFLCVLIALIVYLDPFPNRHIYFATSYPKSDWHAFAENAASILKEKGLDISIINTDGAIDNAIRLFASRCHIGSSLGQASHVHPRVDG